MYYAEELIEEIRLQNDIIGVVSEYVPLKKRGSSYFGLCPFHNEKSASFSVSLDKQIYYCFGCGAGGNVISFIMQIENYDFVEAIKHLAMRVNILLPEAEYSQEAQERLELKKALLNIHKEAAKYFYSNLHSDRGQVGLRYITQRQISTKFQKSFGLGFSNYIRKDLYLYLSNKGYKDEILLKSGLIIEEKNKIGFFDRFGNRLMFPIFDVHNNIIGFGGRILGEGQPKYLNSPETMLFDKSKNLYGLNLARASKNKQIIIVEGYMDTIALHQAGFNSAVASLGTAFNIEQAKLLRKYAEEVILVYDSDDAGTNATLRAIPMLVSSGLKVKILQVTDAKDPDEYIQKYGSEAFKKLLLNSEGYTEFQIGCIKKKYNLENTEHKVRFIMEVSKLLSKLDNAVEQDAYIKQISNITQISQDSIKQEIFKLITKDEKAIVLKNTAKNKPISKYKVENAKTAKGTVEAQKQLLNIIANNEAVYQKIKKYLKAENFIEPCLQKLATKIYELCDKNSNIYPAELINYFDNPEEQRMVTEIFALPVEYSCVSELENAVNDQVKLILKTRIDTISRQSDDIQQMQQLIEDKLNLDKLNITLTDG